MAQVGGALLKGLVRGAQQQHQPLFSHGPHNYISRRAMSRLFVGGLSFTTEEEGLRTAFSKFGEIVDTRIVTDRESGRSRGFGFVTFLSEEDADTAKQKMSGQFLDGRVIRVDRATPRPPPPRFDPPVSEPAEQVTSQEWGSIPSPIAAVPQNAGLAQASSSSAPFDSIGSANGLPDLSTLASPNNTVSTPFPPFSFTPPSDPSPPTRASTKDTGPSFDFIDLDLSNLPPPDPNRLVRRRPPRIRPSSMADYEFGYYMSETSKFPFNTNFETGFQKPKGPEYEFDFTDIREVATVRKAEELAIKKAKEAEEAALMQAKEAEEAALMRDKEAEEVAVKQAEDGAAIIGDKEAEEAEEVAVKQAEDGAAIIGKSSQVALDAADSSQSTMKAEASSHANLSSLMHTASSAIPQASLADSSNVADYSTDAVPEAQQSTVSELQQAA